MEIEAVEPPLNLRRQYLTDKYIARTISRDQVFLKDIHNLAVLDLTKSYWFKKKSPLVAESYRNLSKFQKVLYKGHIPPVYTEKPQVLFSTKIKTEFLSDVQGPMFNVEIQKRWPNYYYLFTDGSKKGNNTACAVYQQYSGQQ
uniref:Uncharacterized protein LOC114334893 n=1 Tax=Diabrotica virgifera virgifera TaxID=50390 RepID=A0A6P7G7K6_DIAVI